MPDEETTAIAEPVVEPVAEVAPAPAPDLHPLEPGGARFSEVYRDMQEARRETARVQGELDAVKRQLGPPPPDPKAPQFYSPNDLQGLVDAGRITPAVMTAQIAWQERQIAKQEMRAEFGLSQQLQKAQGEVAAFMAALPRLGDAASDERLRLDPVLREIAQEMNTTMDDPRAQRRALLQEYGSLEKVKAKPKVVTNPDTYVETAGGGGGKSTSADPLKSVPPAYKQHWERLGYTREQMVEEAKYIRPTPRQRVGLWKA